MAKLHFPLEVAALPLVQVVHQSVCSTRQLDADQSHPTNIA